MHAELAALLKRANGLTATHLPLGGSMVAYDLLLNLYLHHSRGDQVTIKALFASIPYSDMGIRYHMRKLIDDGWLELRPAADDRRTRLCIPTAQFEQAWDLIMQQLSGSNSKVLPVIAPSNHLHP
jgi:DNA-binding MarR family transcriptional regulator